MKQSVPLHDQFHDVLPCISAVFCSRDCDSAGKPMIFASGSVACSSRVVIEKVAEATNETRYIAKPKSVVLLNKMECRQ